MFVQLEGAELKRGRNKLINKYAKCPLLILDEWLINSMNEQEIEFIFGKSYRDFPYAILLSRPATGESVILDVDLSGLGPYLKLYNSGRKNVLLVEELIKEYGEENFVTKYLNIA